MDTRLVCSLVGALLLLLTSPPDCSLNLCKEEPLPLATEPLPLATEPLLPATSRASYLDAMKMLEPAPRDVMWEIRAIGETGWRNVSPEVVAYMDKNAQALAMAKRAAGTTSPAMLSAEGPDLSLEAATFLASCIVARGRELQSERKDVQALDHFVSVLRMGHHLADHEGSDLLPKMIGWGTQDLALAPILELIHHSRLRENNWEDATEALLEMRRARTGLDLAFMRDREQNCSKLPERLDADKEGADLIIAAYEKLDEEVRQTFQESRDERDPNIFREYVEDLEAFVAGQTFPDDPVIDDEFAVTVAKGIMSLDVRSSFANLIHTEQAQEAQLDMLLVGIAAHRHFMETGTRPLRLDDLVPDYLPSVPEDPFSRTGGKIRLHDTGTNWWVYSVGPDGLDQEGRITVEEWEVDGEGDLVSAARHHEDFACCANGH